MFFLYTGAEVSLGAWAYTLLTEARGVPQNIAGVVAGSYWASFTIGRFLAGLYTKHVSMSNIILVKPGWGHLRRHAGVVEPNRGDQRLRHCADWLFHRTDFSRTCFRHPAQGWLSFYGKYHWHADWGCWLGWGARTRRLRSVGKTKFSGNYPWLFVFSFCLDPGLVSLLQPQQKST